MLKEQSERPDLLVGQGTLPRGHARPANAMLYFPVGEAVGIVLYAIRRQLRRSWVEAFRYRRGERVSVRRTVADRAVPPIQVHAGNQIVVGQPDGIGPFGASRWRVASTDVPAAHVSSQPGLASALAGTSPRRRTM